MILVTGATGHLGKVVTNELLKKINASNIAVLARNTEKAKAFAEKGVKVLEGNYDNYDSLLKAFTGIDKLYFVSGSEIPKRMKQHQNVVKAAKQAGVKHIIYTSFQRTTDDETSSIFMVAETHVATEKLIKATGISYTILKHALYTDILPMFLGENILDTKTIYMPAQQGKISLATREDMGKGAAIILTSNGHENKTYEFGGETALDMNDIADILSKLSNQPIGYVSPSQEEFKTTLLGYGVPEEAIRMAAVFSQGIAEDEFNHPTSDLKDILGRELTSASSHLKTLYNL